MNKLPDELIELIAIQSANTWFTLVQIFPILSQRSKIILLDLQRKFLVRDSNEQFYVFYRLPNGMLHNIDEYSRVLNYHDMVCENCTIQFRSGDLVYFKYGHLHSENDNPAILRMKAPKRWYHIIRLYPHIDIVEQYTRKEWWYNGKLHRENDKPAIVDEDGTQEWYQEGQLHRGNNPARILATGKQEWYWKSKKYL